MSFQIRVPKLGESIVEATVSRWLKQEGDTIALDEPVVELETDKVTLEVPAEAEGVLESIVKAEGASVQIGDVLAMISDGVRGNGSGDSQAEAQQQLTPAATVPQEQALAVGATPEVSATPLAQRVADENRIDISQVKGSGPGGRVTKEDVLVHMEEAAPTPQVAIQTPAAATAKQQPVQLEHPQPMQAERSQPAERPQPPMNRAPEKTTSAASVPTLPPALHPQTDKEERIRMSRRRQTIAKRLVEAQQTAAILTTFNEIDLSAVMAVRRRRKESFKERHNIGLGFMSFFTKATVGALKAFPLLNAEIQGDEIVVKHYYDIGIAVGTDQGLVVPVLRDADRKNFAQIESDIVDLAKRARENTLSLTDLQGGTFSITNGGIYGSLMSTPILNTPQVGILGLHKIEERPVALNGEVVIRPMMYVALSYDHRIIDGSDAVRFLVRIKELVEDPEALLLEG